jgi:hypothetical protein
MVPDTFFTQRRPISVKQIFASPQLVTPYATADEAIRSAKEGNRNWINRTHIDRLFGHQIFEAGWSEERVLIRLVSGEVIGIWCDEKGVACDLVSSYSGSAIRPNESSSKPVELVFANQKLMWDKDRLIQELVGRTLSRMVMSDGLLFVYTDDVHITSFSVMSDRETDKMFLFCCDSE